MKQPQKQELACILAVFLFVAGFFFIQFEFTGFAVVEGKEEGRMSIESNQTEALGTQDFSVKSTTQTKLSNLNYNPGTYAVEGKWNTQIITAEPPFEIRSTQIENILTTNTSNITYVNFTVGFQEDFNKSEFKDKNVFIYIKAPKGSLKDIYNFSSNIPTQVLLKNLTKGTDANYVWVYTSISNSTIIKNWNTIKNKTYELNMYLNFSDMSSFMIGIGTNTTVTNFTWETGHLQNNTVRDVFVYKKDFADNVTLSWYQNNNATVDKNLVLLMHLNNETGLEGGNGTLAYDYSYGQNNGTLLGGTKWNTSSKLGASCLDFDGVDDSVSVADDDSLDITDKITIGLWFKLNNQPTSGYPALVCKSESDDWNSPYAEYCFRIFTNAPNIGKLEYFMYTYSAAATTYSTTIPQQGQWYHAVATYDGINVKIYVNGVLETTNAVTPTWGASTQPLSIGVARIGNTDWFKGIIDEVVIYNTSLSKEEVWQLYQSQANNHEIALTDNRIDPISFPNVSYIAVHDLGMDIIDADSGNLWYGAIESSSNALNISTFNTITALGGNIYVGSDHALYDFDFINDTITQYNQSGYALYAGNISTANDAKRYGDLVNAGTAGKEITNPIDGSEGLALLMHLNNETGLEGGNGTLAYDYSTARNNGTLLGGTKWNTSSKLGASCLDFDGTDDFINFTQNNISSLDGATAFTISFWLNNHDATFPNYDAIFIRGSVNQRTPAIFGWSGANFISGYFETTTGGASDCTLAAPTIGGANVWHHWVFGWDGTTCYWYKDGVKSATTDTTTGSTMANADGYIYLGFMSGYGYIDGQIDEFAIWNRTLSATEIVSLHANGIATHFPIKSIEINNQSGTKYLAVATSGGLEILNLTGNSMVCSKFGESINTTVEMNKTAIFYANTTDLGRILNIAGLTNSFTYTDYVTVPKVQDIEVNNTDIFLATQYQLLTYGMNDLLLNINYTGNQSGTSNNFTSIALNGSSLYVGTYGADGAITKLDLSTNLNVDNWSNSPSSNVSLASNSTLALSVWANSTNRFILAGSLGGMSAIRETLTIADATPPTVNLQSPDNNSNISFISRQINLTYNATDTEGTIANCSLILNYEYNKSKANPTETENQTFNITFADGSYLWNVQCEDTLNNKGNSSIRNFTLDITAPAINILSPENNSNFSFASRQINITFNATDLILPVNNCSLFVNNQINKSDATITETENQSFNLTFADGSYLINVQCNDSLNNKGNSSQRNFTLATIPTQSNPVFNATSKYNLTFDNITCTPQNISSPLGNTVYNQTAFWVNDIPYYLAYIPMDIDARDLSGNDNDGTVIKATYQATGGFDNLGYYAFNGKNTSINVSFNNPAQFTIMLWANRPQAGWGLAEKDYTLTAGQYKGFNLRLRSDGKASFHVGNGTNYTSIYGASVMDYNRWYHLTATLNSTSLSLYVNGVSDKTPLSMNGTIVYSTNKLMLGKEGANWFNGSIDDVRIWNRSLTAYEIDMIYRNETNKVHSDSTSTGEVWKCQNYIHDTISYGADANSTTLTILADINPPYVQSIEPLNNTNLSYTSHKVNLTYNVTDTESAVSNCSLILNYEYNKSKANPTETENQTFNITFADGSYLWNVQCEDNTGNKGNSSQRNFTLDTTAPAINILSPENNSNFSFASRQINITFNATDLILPVNNCSLFVNNQINKSDATITETENQSFNLTFADGSYLINVQCNDSLNNKGNSSQRNFSMDLAGPTIALITADATIFTTATQTLQYNITDNLNVTNCSLFIADNIETSSLNITKNTALSFTTAKSDGNYNWLIQCQDELVNKANSSSRTFSVSTGAEEPIQQPAGGGGSSSGAGEATTTTEIQTTFEGTELSFGTLAPGISTITTGLDCLDSINIDANRVARDITFSAREANAFELPPEEEVYRYFEINTNLLKSNLNRIIFNFKVRSSFGNAVLQRYTNSWKQLPTQKIKSENGYDYYQAVSYGASTFAVTKKPEAKITKAIEKPLFMEVAQVYANAEKELTKKEIVLYGIIPICIILFIALLLALLAVRQIIQHRKLILPAIILLILIPILIVPFASEIFYFAILPIAVISLLLIFLIFIILHFIRKKSKIKNSIPQFKKTSAKKTFCKYSKKKHKRKLSINKRKTAKKRVKNG